MALLLTQALTAQTVAWALVKPAGQASTFTPAGGFQYTESGNPVTVQRATGLQHRFWVTIPGGNRGNLHVTPWGGSHYTVLRAWSFTSNAIIAEVDCYTTGGAPAPDGAFTILYREGGRYRSKEAYLYAHNPTTSSYTADPTYAWNETRATPTVSHPATGDYRITLPGLASGWNPERGHVQVTPVGTAPLKAAVLHWGDSGVIGASTDKIVFIRLTDASGNPVDGRFMLSYHEQAAPIDPEFGSGAHVRANQPTAASYTPNPEYADSNGPLSNADITIARINTGNYRVRLPGVPHGGKSTVQASASPDNGEHAVVSSWADDGAGGTSVTVKTYSVLGAPVDAEFTLLYLTDRPSHENAWAWVNPAGQPNEFTASAAYSYTPGGEPVTVTRRTPDQFEVFFPGLSSEHGHVQATAYGGNHTALVNLYGPIGTGVRVIVQLFDAAGGRANDAPFIVSYRSNGDPSRREAYVWSDFSVTSPWTPPLGPSWNGDRGDPTIEHLGPGDFRVILPGLATTSSIEQGHVQVTPFGGFFRRTHIAGWSSVGADLHVRVRTTDAAGTATNARFLLSYAERAAPIAARLGSGSHVWASLPTAGSYAPPGAYTDSNGTLGPANSERIERLGLGYYRVTLPNVAPYGSSIANATLYGPQPGIASVASWSTDGNTGTQVYVRTYDPAGNAADRQFTLQYLTDQPTDSTPASVSVYGSGCHGPSLTFYNRPVADTSWHLRLTTVPAGAVLGAVQLGLMAKNTPVGPVAPGCALLTSGDAATILNLGNPNYFMPIPAGNAFLGLHVYAQGFALVPGVNALSLAATYGLDGQIGDI